MSAPEAREEWNTEALQREFSVIGFSAPYVVVIRKADGVTGTLEFTLSPRVYFDFTEAWPAARARAAHGHQGRSVLGQAATCS